MGIIDDVCKDVVNKLEDSVACGVVDLESGKLLGIHNSVQHAQTLNEVIAAATVDMFRGPNINRIEQMFRSYRGIPENKEDHFQEIHVASTHNHHFVKLIKDGKVAVMLVTKKTINIGMGWAMLKSVILQVEPLIH